MSADPIAGTVTVMSVTLGASWGRRGTLTARRTPAPPAGPQQ